MFIAMNRFKVRKGSEHEFEQVWLTRETHLETMPGFVVFHLLKGPEGDDHVLYARIRFGDRRRISPHGPVPTPSAKRMKAQALTSRSISAIRSSRALASSRR
jgi:hypothetical protein